MSQTVLVTGANGFVGSHTLAALQADQRHPGYRHEYTLRTVSHQVCKSWLRQFLHEF